MASFSLKYPMSANCQSGVVLILSLVILFVLTMLIITSMNSTNIQVLMTGSSQHQMKALNNAELVLREAEQLIDNFTVNKNTLPAVGYYDISTNAYIDFSSFSWDINSAMNSSVEKSHYIIEFTGKHELEGASLNKTQQTEAPGEFEYLYRITTRSQSARGAIRYVQSVYVKSESPR